MRRKLNNAVLVSLILFFCLFTVISAHTGGTDSKGGHTNHATGEYHYHHGYPAHDHTDMDGDGKADCPYNFRDNSGQSSGSQSTKKNSSALNSVSKEKESSSIPSWVYWTIGIMILVCGLFLLIIKWKNDDISLLEESQSRELIRIRESNAADTMRITSEHTAQLEIIRRSCDTQIGSMVSKVSRLTSVNAELWNDIKAKRKQIELLLSVARTVMTEEQFSHLTAMLAELDSGEIVVPSNIFFLEDSTPVSGDISKDKPFGTLTVYVADRGQCYHTDRFCSGFGTPYHAYDVIGRLRPCKKCAADHFGSVPDWYKRMKSITEIETG